MPRDNAAKIAALVCGTMTSRAPMPATLAQMQAAEGEAIAMMRANAYPKTVPDDLAGMPCWVPNTTSIPRTPETPKPENTRLEQAEKCVDMEHSSSRFIGAARRTVAAAARELPYHREED